jgi:hypothetical protein
MRRPRPDGQFRPSAKQMPLVATWCHIENLDHASGWLVREMESTPALFAYAQLKREEARKRRYERRG